MTADPYWTKLVATPDERQRGEALAHGIDHLRRAAAALTAAREGETQSPKIAALDRALEATQRTRRDIEALL